MTQTKRKERTGNHCSMEGCDNEAKVSGLCFACYSYMKYWMQKTPGDVMRRIRRVELFKTRLTKLASQRPNLRRVK